ncbi:mannose-1-phosphate guanylyltransferase [Buchananella hordeovulneris]|uniref:mannose-1-phosphate guanylyltransferase n=1 Tax=Buchananella hordeovulneris TaxID=52770 RepID=UPI000F6010F3|nr:mannose-1-phosphate guanylyltransferase [Buchananella hordeovulneris]RRD43580.1 mannose-1-phosphate guanylyltransferase [Buchananella hordeovulneris]
MLHVIIPAGGAGTRLWPLSRQAHPKFLLDLTGSGRSLLQQTCDRLAPLAASTTVVTGQAHVAAVREQLAEAVELVAEPSPRDSMAAIGLAAAILAARHGDVVVGSFAADHVIRAEAAFQAAVRQAIAGAQAGWIVTIGITPTAPATGFGYIQQGQALAVAGAPNLRQVEVFTEKPAPEVAQAFFAAGSHVWNAGMFVARTSVLLAALERELPALAAGLTEIAAAWDTPEREEVLARLWPGLTKIAIDHAIAEPAAARGQVACVAAEFGWTDVGGYDALAELLPVRDGAHVLGHAEVLTLDSPGSLVTGGPGLVAVLGVPGAVVVRTDDALLVTTRAHAERVKDVVGQLKTNHPTAL